MLSYYNTGRKLKSTAYQRKVMRYWGSIEEIPATLEIKAIIPGEEQGDKAPVVKTVASVPKVEPAQEAFKAAEDPKAEKGTDAAPIQSQDKSGAPPARSFKPE
jgi:hypothetical protein